MTFPPSVAVVAVTLALVGVVIVGATDGGRMSPVAHWSWREFTGLLFDGFPPTWLFPMRIRATTTPSCSPEA